jgi:hypothetical protein
MCAVGIAYETDRRDYSVTTSLMFVRPDDIRVLSCSSGVIQHYQKMMSKAVWRPAPGRKLGFLVVQDDHLLGLIFLASPVIRLTARDDFLFPEKVRSAWMEKHLTSKFNFGKAIKDYMDLSVCVASQPLAWYWNLGKLMALIAPTLGDYVRRRYPEDDFLGVTTTSLWGKSKQYNRIYKFLGYTKGFGHEHVDDELYDQMIKYLRSRCVHCTPNCEDPLPRIPKRVIVGGMLTDDLLPESEWCTIPYARFGDGVNARMRRMTAYYRASGNRKGNDLEGKGAFYHGKKRGVYYHAAVPFDRRDVVIREWYNRWGLPRYERLKDQKPPYTTGLEDRSTSEESGNMVSMISMVGVNESGENL